MKGGGVENLVILIWSKEAIIHYNGISLVLGIIRKYGINYDEISFRLKLPDARLKFSLTLKC